MWHFKAVLVFMVMGKYEIEAGVLCFRMDTAALQKRMRSYRSSSAIPEKIR